MRADAHQEPYPETVTGRNGDLALYLKNNLDWVRNDLQANQDKPTVVFFHEHPLPNGIDWIGGDYTITRDKRGELLDILTT